jgi:predicted dienelactone hydrolase
MEPRAKSRVEDTMHKVIHAALAPLIVLAASGTARALEVPDAPLLKTDKGLTYRAWLPAGFSDRRGDVPLILFSHGFGGCAQQSNRLTRALADAGYAVLAPNHKDEGCERYMGNLAAALGAAALRPEKPFTQPAAWSENTETSRRDDMKALLAFALTHPPYRDAIDPNRIAAMGHSLGGYTALGLAGAWNSWNDPRIKCVLALSPYIAPFVVSDRLGAVRVPVMYQTGTRDIGIGPVLLKQGGYAKTPGRKYLVVLSGAGHFAWTELNPEFQAIIARYAVAFFDRELASKPAPFLDDARPVQVADYRHSP